MVRTPEKCSQEKKCVFRCSLFSVRYLCSTAPLPLHCTALHCTLISVVTGHCRNLSVGSTSIVSFVFPAVVGSGGTGNRLPCGNRRRCKANKALLDAFDYRSAGMLFLEPPELPCSGGYPAFARARHNTRFRWDVGARSGHRNTLDIPETTSRLTHCCAGKSTARQSRQ